MISWLSSSGEHQWPRGMNEVCLGPETKVGCRAGGKMNVEKMIILFIDVLLCSGHDIISFYRVT